jgi:hypothetical protein
LLAKFDHSEGANRLILRGCKLVDLDDVVLEDWVGRLTGLALQDVDISEAAGRWMRYSIPAHRILCGNTRSLLDVQRARFSCTAV